MVRPQRIGCLVGVLAFYGATSLALFGRHILGDPAHVVEGFGPSSAYFGRDQSFYVWSLAWMARSLAHLSNPLLTHAVFAPVGYNLTWTGGVLGPAALAAPLTLVAGPVVSYNALALLAPAFAAWTAFLLCRAVIGKLGPAIAGGFLFGFGTYETVETVNHVNLALTALIPLLALLAVLFYRDQISRSCYIVGAGCVLGAQLWTSSELFATTVVVCAIAVTLFAATWPKRDHARAAQLVSACLAALAVALVVGGPFLYYAFRYPNPVAAISGADHGVDILNLVDPTPVTWLHGSGSIARYALNGHNLTEDLGYLGVPLILLLLLAGRAMWRDPRGRLLPLLGLAVLVASLGAHLTLAGHRSGVPMPWLLASELPLLRYVVPSRLLVFLWLVIAVMAAWWLARAPTVYWRWALFGVVALSLTPTLTGSRWATPVDDPPLLRAADWPSKRGSTILALPFGVAGNSMYWQVESSFRFNLAGGYVSVSLPDAYHRYIHLIRTLQSGRGTSTARRTLCSFLAFAHVDAVILRDRTPGDWTSILRLVATRPERRQGFTIYRPDGAHGRWICH